MVFSLVGQIANTGLVEVPLGTKLGVLLHEIGGGGAGGRRIKAVQTGGPSGGCLPAALFDLPIDYERHEGRGLDHGLRRHGGARRDRVHGRCGALLPGLHARRIVRQVHRLPRGLAPPGADPRPASRTGRAALGDLDLLEEVGEAVKAGSLCGLGQTAPNPVLSTLRYFRDEYEAHVFEHRCPAGKCTMGVTGVVIALEGAGHMPTLTIDDAIGDPRSAIADRYGERPGRRHGAAGGAPGRRAPADPVPLGGAAALRRVPALPGRGGRRSSAGPRWSRRARYPATDGLRGADAGAGGRGRPPDDAGIPAGALPDVRRDPRPGRGGGRDRVALRKRESWHAADELCVLCGLCVRVCRDLVGAAAIAFTGRGAGREVAAPFHIQAEACIGCGACAAVCPTGAVKIEDIGGQRHLVTWNTVVPLKPCPGCGRPFAPEPMAFLTGLADASEHLWGLCPACRRKEAAATVARATV